MKNRLLALLSATALLTGCQTNDLTSNKTPLQLLWDEGTFTEGPVPYQNTILFTDLRRNRIMQFHPRTKRVSVFREDSGSANGLGVDSEGNLLACEGADGGNRRISITGKDGQINTLVDNFEGKKFNSPNDIAIAPNGTVYFTDPRYRGPESVELDFEAVYYVQDGIAKIATRHTERPNGLLISSDGKTAYVADNNNQAGGARTLLKFDIREDGSFANKAVLFAFADHQRGIDGMALDKAGNIYATAGKGKDAGIYIFTPAGNLLHKINVPDFPTNCTFDGEWFYVTAMVRENENGERAFGLYRIKSPNELITK